ncbi:MAG: class I SAM-dependent methyltransferase [Candidatus Puniceispirillaceae bacterium]
MSPSHSERKPADLKTSNEVHLSIEEQNQKAYYNAIANAYDTHYASASSLRYRGELFDRFLKNEPIEGLKVLDAMCGGGQNSGYFMMRGGQVTGVDISDEQCKNYGARYPENEVICCSLFDNGLAENSFDWIITDSLHHMHPKTQECMAEFHRLLKPGGRLVIWEPAAGSIFDYMRQLWYRLDKKYFEENEKSIDLPALTKSQHAQFSLQRKLYGGSTSYLFNNLSMALRISPTKSEFRYKFFDIIERVFELFQTKHTSLWFIAMFEKKL